MVALIPALIVVVGLYGTVADRADVTSQVDSLTGNPPPTTARFIEAQMQEVVATTPATLGLSMFLAILAALWSVSSAVQALVRVVNTAHDLGEGRSFVRLRLTALALGALLAIATCVLLGAIVLLPRVLPDGVGGVLAEWLRWPIMFAFTVGVLSLVYRLSRRSRR
jgi:membrane protein